MVAIQQIGMHFTKMKMKIIIALMIGVFLAGLVVADLTGVSIIPKDETLSSQLPKEVKTALKQEVSNVYWKDNFVLIDGEQGIGTLCYTIDNAEKCVNRTLFSNEFECENMILEDCIKAKMIEQSDKVLENIYEKQVTKTKQVIDVGKKTISLN